PSDLAPLSLHAALPILDFASGVQTHSALDNLTLRTLNQLHQRKSGHGFSATRFSYYTYSRALWDFVSNTVYSLDSTNVGKEVSVDRKSTRLNSSHVKIS